MSLKLECFTLSKIDLIIGEHVKLFENSAGTDPKDAKLHKIVKGFAYFCLFGLVIEGTFFVPFAVAWYGWPTLSMQEICDELNKIVYNDQTRVCHYPYELLAPSEPRRYDDYLKDLSGPSSPVSPMPLYTRLGFRELVEIHKRRLAAEENQ